MTTTTETTTYTPTVGDIFVSSWGYDQTNIDFYQVVKVTPSKKSVYVKPIGQKRTAEHMTSESVVPDPGNFLHRFERRYSPTGSRVERAWDHEADDWVDKFYDSVEVEIEPELKRLKYWRGQPSFKVASYANAYLWDGSPKHQTAFGFGH